MMPSRLLAFWHSWSGSSAVEFAAVVAPLVLLIMGGIEFGRVMYTRQALHETALQTARCMGILQTDCTTSGAISTAASISFAQAISSGWFVALEADEIDVDSTATCGGVSDFSQVTITHEFQTALPTFVTDMANATTLVSTACFPNATPPA
jgi:Flp pilus assembly protein TadG